MGRIPESQRVRDALETAVLDGHYRPGHRLDPAQLEREFGCSRTPIREALQALERSGLVQIRPKQGTYVTEMSIAEVAERFEVMAELEGMAARLAAGRIERESLAELEDALRECESHAVSGDADAYYYANARFHGIVNDSCGNEYLRQQAYALKRVLQPYRRLQLRVPDRMRRSLAEHRAIADAIASGDAGAAENAARDHVLVQVKEFSHLVRTWKHLSAS
ncbi:GntR family transcriptional regulator [Mycolicibacterium murale]|jgi:DNA-binding GntR family transcriptional regulator|uniref:GntR family transcriptional regulator n=1 Tax=Mycolicibacterium murale TaxID=182220 RepID=A0A7I9WGX6_9MYCO|nr:GntR family transcriptional regulator [Mycolicibacterium murale]MCV7183013.1 GntR family transcriptional regulator [Mycolicibacterium murale]GFG56568.1 GntR family transcriptional regulator [Mycolicibacterium murale]